jgi:phenylpropionate dioxygenase-like ring-hydroxylating dioxygenase large terminal subunit
MKFIKNDWYIAAWANELTEKPMARTIGNQPVVLYRDTNGKVAALLDRCCHRGVPLSLGEVVPQGLQCGYHGLVFNADGKCVSIPGQERIPVRACVRHFAVEERDETIWIWLGDPEKADRSRIIDYPYHNDYQNWPHKYGMLRLEGNYMNVIDNLMDLTHLAYIHKGTIGSGPVQAHVEAIMKTDKTPTGVKFTRWMLDHEPPATYANAINFQGKVDRWQEFEFVAPGNVVQFTGATDANTGAYDQGKREGGFALRILHSVTPESDNSCFYFFSAANGYRQNEPAATEALFAEIVRTFMEDKIFIELQQARLNQLPEPALVDIASDGARTHARRHVTSRIAEEESLNPVTPAVNSAQRMEPAH